MKVTKLSELSEYLQFPGLDDFQSFGEKKNLWQQVGQRRRKTVRQIFRPRTCDAESKVFISILIILNNPN